MSRRAPFTQRQVDARRQLSANQHDFKGALCILRLNGDQRQKRTNELHLICQLYYLTRITECQETAASKAEAFQRAIRWEKHRQQARADIQALYPIEVMLDLFPDSPQGLEAERISTQAINLYYRELGFEQEAKSRVEAAMKTLSRPDRLPEALDGSCQVANPPRRIVQRGMLQKAAGQIPQRRKDRGQMKASRSYNWFNACKFLRAA